MEIIVVNIIMVIKYILSVEIVLILITFYYFNYYYNKIIILFFSLSQIYFNYF